jgi:dolichyl-phosphate-mannose--protein O-mannosyl transferase
MWRGWWAYQHAILQFHEHLDAPHPAKSAPFSWLVLGRAVPYDYLGTGYGQKTQYGGQVCKAADSCSQEILAIGNPAVWWVGSACLVVMIGLWVWRRDWRAALVVVSFATSFLPWELFPSRTMFLFYALPLLPFMVLGITATAGLVLGPREASDTRRLVGALTLGVYLIAVVLLFAYFYPILTDQMISLSGWRARMWFPGWVVSG